MELNYVKVSFLKIMFSSQDVNHDDFELTFKYTFLAPSVETLPFDLQGVNSQALGLTF